MTLAIDEIKLEGVAEKAAFLVNGSHYFSQLADTLRHAQKRIWIIGWDFNPDILLEPEHSEQTLGELLENLAQSNPNLEIKILIWALGPIYSEKSFHVVTKADFPRNGRIELRFALQSVLRGCHHQKLVCVDDTVAFIGGIDLTSRRWDTRRHKVRDGRRRDPDGASYEPLHDLQVMVTGQAAGLISMVARRRWYDATGQIFEPLPKQAVSDWPNGSAVSLHDVPVRLALSEPDTLFRLGVHHGIHMTKEIIARANKQLYIETQYLASFSVAEALAARLQEPLGPGVVIICAATSHGLIENMIMGGNRDRIIQRLRRADRYKRLRIFHPVIREGAELAELFVHSKLLISDDNLLRIGSSNLNHRSEGLDTECDILFEASRADHRLAIAQLRNLLIAEYLGCRPDIVENTVRRKGSLIAAIDELNVQSESLLSFVPAGKKERPIFGTGLFDPVRPLGQSVRILVNRFIRRLPIAGVSMKHDFADEEERRTKHEREKKIETAKCDQGAD